MLLTKDQQKHITKTLKKVSDDIKEAQEEEKERYLKIRESGASDLYSRGRKHGMEAGLEKAYHIAKSAAEESYQAEYQGADQEIESICKQLEAQSKVVQEILPEQAELTKQLIKKIRLILHLSKYS